MWNICDIQWIDIPALNGCFPVSRTMEESRGTKASGVLMSLESIVLGGFMILISYIIFVSIMKKVVDCDRKR